MKSSGRKSVSGGNEKKKMIENHKTPVAPVRESKNVIISVLDEPSVFQWILYFAFFFVFTRRRVALKASIRSLTRQNLKNENMKPVTKRIRRSFGCVRRESGSGQN